MLDMAHRVWLEKISLVTSTLFCFPDQENYAREMLEEQMRQEWEGLASEVQEICLEVGLRDACTEYVSRKEAFEAITFHNMKVVKEEMEAKAPKKLKHMRKLDCSKQQAFMKQASLQDSRLEFLWLSNILDTRTTRGNKYSNKFCPHCREGAGGQGGGVSSTPGGILRGVYADLRYRLDPLLGQHDRNLFLKQAIRVTQGTQKSYQNEPLSVLPERPSDLIHPSQQPPVASSTKLVALQVLPLSVFLLQ